MSISRDTKFWDSQDRPLETGHLEQLDTFKRSAEDIRGRLFLSNSNRKDLIAAGKFSTFLQAIITNLSHSKKTDTSNVSVSGLRQGACENAGSQFFQRGVRQESNEQCIPLSAQRDCPLIQLWKAKVFTIGFLFPQKEDSICTKNPLRNQHSGDLCLFLPQRSF